MYKRVLLLLDLEGVNLVKGEAYSGLSRDSQEWKIAIKQAPIEINAAAKALFDAGVEKVGFWDNHGAGYNVDVSLLDPRLIIHDTDFTKPRMDFAINEYDAACYFGYHAMEGTLGGVLAHTYSSAAIQFYKINGQYVSELDMDASILAEHDIPSVFFVAGDITCKQAKRSLPDIVTVVTKTEISRNQAEFRNNDELIKDISTQIVQAVKNHVKPKKLNFPISFEKSFKRTEDAEIYYNRLISNGIEADYLKDEILGKDAHTVVSTIHDIVEFNKSI